MWINYLWRSYNWLDQDRNSGDLAIQYWPEPLCQPLLGARWLHSCTDKPCITWILVALQPWSRRAHFPTVQTSAGHDPGTGVQAETVGQVVYVNEVPRLGSSTWKWELGQGKKILLFIQLQGTAQTLKWTACSLPPRSSQMSSDNHSSSGSFSKHSLNGCVEIAVAGFSS